MEFGLYDALYVAAMIGFVTSAVALIVVFLTRSDTATLVLIVSFVLSSLLYVFVTTPTENNNKTVETVEALKNGGTIICGENPEIIVSISNGWSISNESYVQKDDTRFRISDCYTME